MIARVTLALFLTACLAAVGLNAPSRAQFNGCSAGFCNLSGAAGGAAVAVDVCGTNTRLGSSGTSFNYTGLTITGGLTNSAVVAVLGFNVSTITGLTATWNGVAMSQIVTHNTATAGVGRVDLWGLIAPASGNQTLALSWTGSSNVTVDACSWSNVKQTGGATSFPNSAGAQGTTATSTITITSASGHAVMAGHVAGSPSPTITAVNNTQVFIDNVFNVATAGNRAAGSGSVTMTSTLSSGFNWGVVGTDISN